MRTLASISLVLLVGGCGDGGSEPAPPPLVPRILRLTPRPDPAPGEAGLYVDLEVRSPSATPYPGALVKWEVTHGAVLSAAVTDEAGELQALWTFTLAVEPPGTVAAIRACARREASDPCAYGEPAEIEVP